MTEAGNAERNIERAMVRPTQLVWYVIGLILSFMAVAPLFWMVSMAFKKTDEVFGQNLVPHHPTLDNFLYVFTQVRFLPLSLEHVFRIRHSHDRRLVLSFDGGICAGASTVSRARRDIPNDVRDFSDLATRHHRPALHSRALARPARQLCRFDHPLDLQRLRHLSVAAVLSGGAARVGGGGGHRWRRLLPRLLEHHSAAEPADPVGARDPVLPRQLEFVS